jgi:hypothetical protein
MQLVPLQRGAKVASAEGSYRRRRGFRARRRAAARAEGGEAKEARLHKLNPVETHSVKAPGLSAWFKRLIQTLERIKVRNRFQSLLSNLNLYRYAEGRPSQGQGGAGDRRRGRRERKRRGGACTIQIQL